MKHKRLFLNERSIEKCVYDYHDGLCLKSQAMHLKMGHQFSKSALMNRKRRWFYNYYSSACAHLSQHITHYAGYYF